MTEIEYQIYLTQAKICRIVIDKHKGNFSLNPPFIYKHKHEVGGQWEITGIKAVNKILKPLEKAEKLGYYFDYIGGNGSATYTLALFTTKEHSNDSPDNSFKQKWVSDMLDFWQELYDFIKTESVKK